MCNITIESFSFFKKSATKWCGSIIAVAVLWLGLLLPAHAGLLTINVDRGTSVSIAYDSDGDKKVDKTQGPQKDVDNDGKVSFGLGTLAEEAKIKKVLIEKESDKRKIQYEITLDADGNTLASLEPFFIPFFSSDLPVFAYIDMVSYLSMAPLTLGDSFAVINGGVAGLSGFMFKDATSLAGISLGDIDDSLINSLADFSGDITVSGFDTAVNVPESSSFILYLSGILLLGLNRLRRRVNSK